MGPSDLYSLLGLGPDASVPELRLAYERAVNEAAKSYNLTRAKQLSQAFDDLPLGVREAMYAGRGIGGREFAVPAGRSKGRSNLRRGRTPSPRRRFAPSPLLVLVAIVVLVILLAQIGR